MSRFSVFTSDVSNNITTSNEQVLEQISIPFSSRVIVSVAFQLENVSSSDSIKHGEGITKEGSLRAGYSVLLRDEINIVGNRLSSASL